MKVDLPRLKNDVVVLGKDATVSSLAGGKTLYRNKGENEYCILTEISPKVYERLTKIYPPEKLIVHFFQWDYIIDKYRSDKHYTAFLDRLRMWNIDKICIMENYNAMGRKNQKLSQAMKGNKNASVFVDWDEADRLLRIGATGEEIAAVLGVSYSTLARRCKEEKNMLFDDYIKTGNTAYKISLRRLQARAAQGFTDVVRDENGNIIDRKYNPPNVGMQIWLGKQYLGQKEIVEQTLKVPQINVTAMSDDEMKEIETALIAIERHEGNQDIQPEYDGDTEEQEVHN